METNWKLAKRIPYLDGLRAYSIAAVVLGHSLPLIPLFQHSWAMPIAIVFGDGGLGVRVFFVISGFLITTLLLEEREKTGKISIRGFYERRVARIFPAFYTYFLFILALIGLHWLNISWQPLVAAATYTWNYGHWWWGNISEDASYTLGHLWSLALEEQFYLFWPACLVLIGNKGSRRLATAAVVLMPFIRVALYYLRPTDRGQLMMMFHSGADSILWGALAAFAARDGAIDRLRNYRFRALVPWGAVTVLFVLCPALVHLNRGFGVVLVPSAGSLAVIAFMFWLLAGERGAVRCVFELAPLVRIGLLSYSIYIWQEIFTLWRGWPPLLSSVGVRWFCVLLFSSLSYYVVEVPLRRRIRQWFAQPSMAD